MGLLLPTEPNPRPMTTGSFSGSLRLLFAHMPKRRRRQLALLLALMLCGAAAELLSVGAVIPFITALADPEAASQIGLISHLMAVTGTEVADLAWLLSLAFAALIILASGTRLLLLWATIRYANGLGAELGCKLYEKTLHRPYSFHVSHNTSKIIGSINKIQRVIIGFVLPLLSGASALVVALALVALLMAIEPIAALGGALVFATSYLIIAWSVRRRLRRDGQIIALENDKRVQAVQEGLGGIRDVILDRAQPIYTRRFTRIEQRFREAQAASQFIGSFPRMAVEAIGMLMLLGLAVYFTSKGDGLTGLLPLLGVLAVGSAKLMPLVQQIYAGWSTVAASQASVNDVLALLDYEPPSQQPPEAVSFSERIRLENIEFRYGTEADSKPVLSGLSLDIGRGEKLGIVGATGSGKSTLVDLLMGLLSPTTGRFLVDDTGITENNSAAWQRHIAHVPQSIYLSDSSIAENIAFGVDASKLDMAKVEQAARAAQIHDHIATLPAGYQTLVGERGVRLSGGQRQRIGIARALYKQVDVLVLDEATSALDDATEARVMEAIARWTGNMTVIMIAHRLTTMQWCDRIIEMDQGRVRRELTYAQLTAAAGGDS